MDIGWNENLRSQLEWHWENQLRPRLDGLTDEEYYWEPVGQAWTVRPVPGTHGVWAMDSTDDKAGDAPFTTIAWRMAHLVSGVFGERNASHFGGPPKDGKSIEFGTADEALKQLDEGYAHWIDGVKALGEDGLARPCGPAEGPFSEYPLSALVLHIHREVIHHGAEVCTLRDLYLWRNR